MQLTIRLETVVYGIFYLGLIAVLIVPLQKLIDSPTAFEESQSGNIAELPSITICPLPSDPLNYHNDIKDFNDAHVAVEKTKKEYFGTMIWSKAYGEW